MSCFKGWREERRLERHVCERVTRHRYHLTAPSCAKGQQLCFRMSLCGCEAHIHPTQEITASPGPALTCAPSWLRPCSPVGSEALLNSSHAACTSEASHYFLVALTNHFSFLLHASFFFFFFYQQKINAAAVDLNRHLLLGYVNQQTSPFLLSSMKYELCR